MCAITLNKKEITYNLLLIIALELTVVVVAAVGFIACNNQRFLTSSSWINRKN